MFVRPADRDEETRLRDFLTSLQGSTDPLPGLFEEGCLDVLIDQLIESQRRNRYVQLLLEMQLSPSSLDGTQGKFDPLKGAILKGRAGDHDEACWLIFLSVHFGRNRRTDWQLAGDVYSRLGSGGTWDWVSVSGDVFGMRLWLDANRNALRTRGGGFGNHRKYESLDAWRSTGTGHVVATYVDWVGDRTHAERFDQVTRHELTPRERFAALYAAAAPIARFGRTARFDFVSMLGKVGLVDVEPDSAHLSGATGPLAGARLLLDGSRESTTEVKDLEKRLSGLQQGLNVPFDVLEDALCNWQKSPHNFVPFRG